MTDLDGLRPIHYQEVEEEADERDAFPGQGASFDSVRQGAAAEAPFIGRGVSGT